ncbi:hypothetical protein P4133_01915 [Pseudomonas aeruginosa]|nr:hypothetical protein [Pseudomonas aeruginosa]
MPDGVIGPIVNDEYGDVYGLMYAIKGDGIGHAELSDVAEDIKRRMLKVPMVKKIDVIGKQAKRVYVEFSPPRASRPRWASPRWPSPTASRARIRCCLRARSTPAATASWCVLVASSPA